MEDNSVEMEGSIETTFKPAYTTLLEQPKFHKTRNGSWLDYAWSLLKKKSYHLVQID